MTEKTLVEEIITLVESYSNNNPAPLECRIITVYNDGFVDAETSNGRFNYLKCYGATNVGSDGVIIFPRGDLNNAQVISIGDYYTREEIDDIIEEIISGQIDLRNYVKKSDVDLKFDLETNGYITMGLDIGDGF